MGLSCYYFKQKLEEQIHSSFQSGHISEEESLQAKGEKRKLYPDGNFLTEISLSAF